MRLKTIKQKTRQDIRQNLTLVPLAIRKNIGDTLDYQIKRVTFKN